MHTMWKGSISFGLVNIPIKIYAATENKDIRFRSLHEECHTPIKYQKYCPTCETTVENNDIVKGYEYESGKFVTVSQEEINEIKGETTRSVEIMDFVNLDDIDPIYFNKSYFIGPNDQGEKAYALLKQALDDTNKIGIAKITMHSKQHLAIVRCYEQGLLMETIYYPEEVRDVGNVPGIDQDINVDDKELNTAKQLIEQLTAEFDPEKYTNEYREDLHDMIEAKINGNEIAKPEQAPEKENVVDLLSALQKSIDETDESTEKTGKNDDEPANTGTKPSKKTAAGKKKKQKSS
ncbi:non-homologous end joining protein Ku [Tuberibacillus sp. Marseille-P3662]|uniref:non-homologous end joining protein Ku n=1 Tax=Tuberibacillus sp. Marseille-P3662 TaxID=1965358 RepID=UPI000A1CD668|nr:Ku protein [Tuberibacillus sp. Marseille-P3662]